MPTAKFPEMPDLFDPACGKSPAAMDNYFGDELEEGETLADRIWIDEGTLDRDSGLFLCDDCYIKLGMPATREGWKATRANLQALGVNMSG